MEEHKKDDNNISGIDKLQKDLYAREESAEITSRQQSLAGLTEREVDEEALNRKETTPEFSDVMGLRAKRRRQFLIIGGVVAVILILLVIGIFGTISYRNSRIVTEENISLVAQAPKDFTSGQDITYILNYANESKVDWSNTEIAFTPPQGFQLEESDIDLREEGQKYIGSIGELPAEKTGQIKITGSLIGEQDTVALASFDLSVTPSNFEQATVTKNVQISTVIAAVPLEVSIEASDKASQGDRVLATIRIRNISDTTVSGAYIKLDPSMGTQLAIEDEAFSSGFVATESTWELPPMGSLEEVERVAILYVEGQEGEHRPLQVEVGIESGEERFVQRTLNHLITMSTSELFVEQVYNNSNESQVVYPGDEISGVIRYKNVGTSGLKNIIIEVSLEGTGFNPSSLNLTNGSYNPRDRKITWSAATVPELATLLPQEEGEIEYKFTILESDDFPTDVNSGGEGFSIVSVATIDSPDLPVPQGQEKKVVSSRHVLSVGTNLTVVADAFYDDGRLGINSSGPLPPEVGEETTYTVRFRVGSTLNAMGDTKLIAVLPDGVQYTGNHYLTTGSVNYNERTGEVIWTLPLIDKLTGRTKPPHELHVQVSIIPGENQKGRTVSFVRSIDAVGTDLFVDKEIKQNLNQYPSTETASPLNGRVQ